MVRHESAHKSYSATLPSTAPFNDNHPFFSPELASHQQRPNARGRDGPQASCLISQTEATFSFLIPAKAEAVEASQVCCPLMTSSACGASSLLLGPIQSWREEGLSTSRGPPGSQSGPPYISCIQVALPLRTSKRTE